MNSVYTRCWGYSQAQMCPGCEERLGATCSNKQRQQREGLAHLLFHYPQESTLDKALQLHACAQAPQELRWENLCSSFRRMSPCSCCWCPGRLLELYQSFGDPYCVSCLLFPHCHGVKVTRFVTCVVKTEKILYPICKIQAEIEPLEK